MSETWYKTTWGGYTGEIEPVEVSKQTEKSVGISYTDYRGRTSVRLYKKVGKYYNYFQTWAEAHAYLLKRITRKIGMDTAELERAQTELERISNMQPPEVKP